MFNYFVLLLACIMPFNLFALESLSQVLVRHQMVPSAIEESISVLPVFKVVEKKIGEQIQSLKIYIENSTDIYIVKKNNFETTITKSKKTYQLIKKIIKGKVRGNLFESILSDLKNESVAKVLSAAFKEDFVTTKGLRVDAVYSMTAEAIYEDDAFIELGNVLNAKLTVGKAVVEKVLEQELENGPLVLSNIIPLESEKVFVSPIGSNVVSSFFNLTRKHPLRKRIQPHNGIDLKAQSGTSVYPALEGEIIGLGRTSSKGKFVLIRHANGFETTYDHLKSFNKKLHLGMQVEIHDQIGKVGKTGLATGAHLHFGMLKDGQYVNPLYYFKDYRLPDEKVLL